MTLIVAWILFPAVLAVLCLGIGALVERLSRVPLPGPVLLSIGLAGMIVVTQACTYWDATAELATPLVVVLAVAGIVVARERLRALRPDGWALAAAAGVFAVFAAPVFLSGDPTFAGYGVLGDTSIHFVLIDRLMEHGRNVSDLAPSSYKSALQGYFDTAYPTGAHTALGAARPLVGQDVAWVFQPFLAFVMALTAGLLYELAGSVVRPRFARAAIAFVAAQPALVFAYSLQGSIKEIATVWALALLVVLVPLVVTQRVLGLWRLVPVAVAIAAALEVLGLAIAPWLGPLLVATLAALLWLRGRPGVRTTAIEAAVAGAAAVVLAFPVLLRSKTFVSATKGVVTAPSEFGNLFGPLHRVQALGVWPSGDFRLSPSPGRDYDATYVLIGIVVAACVLGVAWCVRRRAWLPLLFLGVSLIGWGYATSRGSPWVDAKALMIVSMPLVFTAMLGAAGLLTGGRRPEGALLAAVIAAGVLWSNALAYHDVSLAPRDRLKELASVGERVDGRGPVLYPEFEEYGKHFLRDGDPTGWTEAWQPGPEKGPFAAYQDIDQVPLNVVLRYPTLVLRRSPSGSRPPSPYELRSAGRYYEVWERPPNAPGQVIAHLPLGSPIDAGARPRCSDVRRIARQARGGALAYVERPRTFAVIPASGQMPPGWGVDGTDPNAVRPVGAGRIGLPLDARRGNGEAWLGGSIGRRVALALDGRGIGGVSYELSGPGQYFDVGRVVTREGRETVEVSRGGGGLHPGDGGQYSLIGPVVIEPAGAQRRELRRLDPARWRSLCDRHLDWIEAVRND